MKVKLRKNRTLVSPDCVWIAGQVIDVPDEAAAKLIAAEYADPVEDEPEVETAALEPVLETATIPAAKKRRTRKRKT